jgi:hypothetical protein
MSRHGMTDQDRIKENNIKIAENNNRYSNTILTPPTELLYKENIHRILGDVISTSRPEIFLHTGSTQDAINSYRARDTSITVLNFASSIQAGGGYLTGNQTQEEALCRHTPSLYPSYCALSKTIGGTSTSRDRPYVNEFRNGAHYWPAWRNTWDSCIMYTRKIENYNNALSSGNYEFKVATDTYIDVIAASAPKLDGKMPVPSDAEYDRLLGAVCKLAVINSSKRVTTPVLILGAWGCGAYGNDPRTISLSFQRVISNIQWPRGFKIVFAILPGRDNNLATFQTIFSGATPSGGPGTSRPDSKLQSPIFGTDTSRPDSGLQSPTFGTDTSRPDSKLRPPTFSTGTARPDSVLQSSRSSADTCVSQNGIITHLYKSDSGRLSLFNNDRSIYSHRVDVKELTDRNIQLCVNEVLKNNPNAVYVYMINREYYVAWNRGRTYYYAWLPDFQQRGGSLAHGLYDTNKYVYKLLP